MLKLTTFLVLLPSSIFGMFNKEEKSRLPVDVRGSKTSVLKLPIFKIAAMLQIPRAFPLVSCLGSAKAVQCPRPEPKIGNKSQQIPRYSPVCPRGQPPGVAAA